MKAKFSVRLNRDGFYELFINSCYVATYTSESTARRNGEEILKDKARKAFPTYTVRNVWHE